MDLDRWYFSDEIAQLGHMISVTGLVTLWKHMVNLSHIKERKHPCTPVSLEIKYVIRVHASPV